MPVFPMSVRPLIVRQGTTNVAGFLPTDISGLVAWYDASQITGLSDGEAVATWSDSSGNGHNATQGTAGSRPLYKTGIINGLPVVRFDGVDDLLLSTTPNPSEAQPITLAIVVKFATTVSATNQILLDGVANPSANRCILYSDASDPESWAYFAGTVQVSATAVDTNWHYLVAVFNGASSLLRLDGTTISTANPGAQDMVGIDIGSATGDSRSAADIAEVVRYGGLTAAQYTQLEAYFASKYGI